MIWACPTCSTTICAPEDRFGARWSYTRCCSCGAAALVSLTETTPVPVELVPVHENLVATERYIPGMVIRNSIETVLPEPMPAPPPLATTATHDDANARLETKTARRRLPIAPLVTGLALALAGVALFQYQRALKELRGEVTAAKSAPAAQPIEHRSSPVHAAVSDSAEDRVPARRREAPPSDSPKPVETSAVPSSVPATPPMPAMVVQPRVGSARLRMGPGVDYPQLGLANPASKYVVKMWKDRWFQIEDLTHPQPGTEIWIRNDLVAKTHP